MSNCEHIQKGYSAEISDSGLCGFCWKYRAMAADSECDRQHDMWKKSEASVAEMRALIEHWPCPDCDGRGWYSTGHINNRENVKEIQEQCEFCFAKSHALSSDCGQGYVSPDKARVLVEALEKARECLCCLNAYDYPSSTKRSEVINPVLGSISGVLDALKEAQ